MHVLNTGVYRSMVSETAYVLLAFGGARYRERFEDFGLQLETLVERWTGIDASDDERRGLFQAMISYLNAILLPAARKLYAEASTREQGLATYKILIHLYVDYRLLLKDRLCFGSIANVIASAFPTIIGREFHEIELGELVDAAHTVARLDEAYGAPQAQGGSWTLAWGWITGATAKMSRMAHPYRPQ